VSKDQLLAYTWTDWSQELQQHLWRHPIRGASRADRIMDFVRRVTRALKREPKLASAAEVDAGAGPQRRGAAQRSQRRDGTRRRRGARKFAPSGREGIRNILGQVWYANLLLWVNGRIPVSRLYENMETACRLLISHHESRY
jgi:hypothetical protein